MITARFITFEGGEGSGKSTQVLLLAERLRGLGHEVVVTREPGGTPLAEAIRALILASKPESAVAEFLLFAAARAEHIADVIGPAVMRGAYVICDRYIHSTRVYQGHLGHVDLVLIEDIEKATVSPFYPGLTVVLDVPVAVGMARANVRGERNRYDGKDVSWHHALRQAFLDEAASTEPTPCVVIDGDREAARVAEDVWRAVQSRLLAGA